MMIGLTGLAGSGKDLAASFLKKKGFSYYSLSDILREECQKVGQETNRDNLIEMGNKLRAQFGFEVLASKTREKIKLNKNEKAVIVSIRHPAEVEELRREPDFKLVAIMAPLKLRYQRIASRGRPEDAVSLEKFREQEERELAGRGSQQQLQKVIEMADYAINNEGAVEELRRQVENVIDNLKIKNQNDT